MFSPLGGRHNLPVGQEKMVYVVVLNFCADLLHQHISLLSAHTRMYYKGARAQKHDPPMRGTESDVAGMISATRSMKTVSESSTVMP